jgi:hypothetical protein
MQWLAALPQEIWIISAVVAALLLGVVQLLRELARMQDRLVFGKEYRNRFIDYANSQGADRQTYQWLTLKAQQMQGDMGDAGVYAGFRPPFEQVVYKNYPIILNMLPRIRQMMDSNEFGLWRGQIHEYVHAVDEALLRYLGPLEDSYATGKRELANPLRWFQVGVSQVLSLPLYLLALFGLMGARTIEAIQRAALFRLLTGLAALIGLAAAVAGLIVDWSDAIAIVTSLWAS